MIYLFLSQHLFPYPNNIHRIANAGLLINVALYAIAVDFDPAVFRPFVGSLHIFTIIVFVYITYCFSVWRDWLLCNMFVIRCEGDISLGSSRAVSDLERIALIGLISTLLVSIFNFFVGMVVFVWLGLRLSVEVGMSRSKIYRYEVFNKPLLHGKTILNCDRQYLSKITKAYRVGLYPYPEKTGT